ncbi:hypothetical protein [Streptomyces swartbergensis]|uniref:Uncharacterized protein n=1 Tax=Streptomyces swartbergensis TaxID=487165 RepID=A0A243S712_9ACTN|nr:hypothetical protein [Streptomyces swartbergensis]OUD03338.1 hypothetical protein CA983_10030 [Streptomyces swartbergensis]
MTNTETARELLYRHGLPEDVIDGALCLHAQELASVQRKDAAVWGVDTAAGQHRLAAADLIDPTHAVPAAVPPVDRAALHDRIAAALAREDARTCGWGHGFLDRYGADAETDGFVDAVLAVLPEPADRAEWDALCRDADRLRKDGVQLRARADRIDAMVQQLCADRAAVLLEAADCAEIVALRLRMKHDVGAANGAYEVMAELRRMAAEAQTGTEAPARDCPACEAGIGHSEHCPTPETHKWGCGCHTDPAAEAQQDGAQS